VRQFPLAARVVEVIADRGEDCSPRYRFGSGCLVAGRTVLTAAHVVEGAVRVLVRGQDKVTLPAVSDPEFTGDAAGPRPDLALLEIVGGGIDVPAMGLAAVRRDSQAGDPVERCHAVGYPVFMERERAGVGRVRETADALGQIPVLSGLAGGLLSVQVSSAPRPLPPADVKLGDSQWSGMSGGPVVADGRLVAVVTEHAPRAGDAVITATPLTALEHDPAHPGWGPGVANAGAWWTRLGSPGIRALPLLPGGTSQVEPAYRATVREIRQRTRTLVGRQQELAEISAFATGTESYLRLAGGSWAGKTSLLAEAAVALQGDVDVVCYFLSRREGDADSARFLTAVVPQLAYLVGREAPAADLHEFRSLWQLAAQAAVERDRHLLLVIDGLDEDLRPPGLPSVAALLPITMSRRAHVLVSGRHHPELPIDIPHPHPLAGATQVTLPPFPAAADLSALARQEIDGLIRWEDDGLAVEVLGLLTAAAGPLAVEDLAALIGTGRSSAAVTRRVRRLVVSDAARSLQRFGPAGGSRYQFAHDSLLEYARASDDLNDPEFRRRIHQWAQTWRVAGWSEGTPGYLLDTYPSTMAHEPGLLTALVTDAGWITAAIGRVGADAVLADLRRSVAAHPFDEAATAMLAVLIRQLHYLRNSRSLRQPGLILRQLCLQALELGEHRLATDIRARLTSRPGPGLTPVWTTRNTDRGLSDELDSGGRIVNGLVSLPDGWLAGAAFDGSVLVWMPGAAGGAPITLTSWSRSSSLLAAAGLSDGHVVTGGADGRVLLWNPHAPGSKPTELGRHGRKVLAAAVLPDGRISTGGFDRQVWLWAPGAPGRAMAGMAGKIVPAMAALPDGRLVVGRNDGTILLWNPDRQDAPPVELGRHNGPVRAVARLPDGGIIVSSTDGRVLIWDPDSPGSAPDELGNGSEPVVLALAPLPDGRVVTGSADGWVLLWDSAASGSTAVRLGRHDQRVLAIAAMPDGRVATSGADRRVLIWDPATPQTTTAARSRPVAPGRDAAVRALVALPGGRVLTSGDDGRLLIWNLSRPGDICAELGRQAGAPRQIAVLSDGRVATKGMNRTILIWDPAHPGSVPVEMGPARGRLWAIAGFSDGRVVTATSDRRLLVWDPADPGSPLRLGLHRGIVRAAAMSPDNRVVTAGADGKVLVWDPADPGRDPVVVGRHTNGTVILALPDGRIVTGGSDGCVLMWNLDATGSPTLLGRHYGAIRCATVLPGGQVITGDSDASVLLWDPASPGIAQAELRCTVTGLAAVSLDQRSSHLVIAHEAVGLSLWTTGL
jgi:WD40 repeat protein